MNARVKVCTRSSYTCRVTRGCHRIESNHARQSSRSVRTPRVSMRVIDQVYFIRFDSRVGWFHASSRRRRRARVRHHEKSMHLFRIHPFMHTYLVVLVVLVVVQVCTRASVGCVIFISSTPVVGRLRRHPRRGLERTNRVCASSSPVFFHQTRRRSTTSPPRRSFSPVRLTRRGCFHTRMWRGYFSGAHSSVRCSRSSIDAIGAFGGRRNVSSATDRTVGVFFFVCVDVIKKKTKSGIPIDGETVSVRWFANDKGY